MRAIEQEAPTSKSLIKWWEHVTLTYDEIEKIAGLPIDHSFLRFKKELTEFGYQVGKISMKEQTVEFIKE